jgi:NAD(P)-dependent dehydrogenase (short-subunit alcohol dehydrogenase family)
MDAKTFVVVGGTSGLGLEVARALIAGHRVVVLGDVEDEVSAARSELGCTGMTCDISECDEVRRTLDEIAAANGGIDGLLHSAAVWAGGALEDLPPNLIRRAIEVNVLGTTYLLSEAIRQMKQRGRGNIVYVGATAVDMPRPGVPLYRATKSFGKSLVESLAQAEGDKGIKVMQLHPGPMPTKLQERVGAEFLDQVYATPAQVAAEVVRLLTLAPDDLYVSGHKVLRADGRW